LFTDGWVSNRQLQITIAIACAWSGWLALRTRTAALSTVSVILVFLLAIAVMADFGLIHWLDNEQYDRLSFRLWPLVLVYGLGAYLLERRDRSWFARPGFVAGALTMVVALDLLALNGAMFDHFGIGMGALQPTDVEDPDLLPTLTALALNGVIFYAAAAVLEKYGTAAMTPATQFLFVIAPFSMLEPLAYLSRTGIYFERFDWTYLALAVGIAIISHQRQRKSFYYAGLINAGIALVLIAIRYEWLDDLSWGVSIVAIGLATLVAGFLIDARRRRTP
jgi:hypothetical protein